MLSQAAGYFHDTCHGPPVRTGGVTVTQVQAEQAIAVLERAGGAAVAQVLRAAGSPLADCDYHAAAAPFLDQARARCSGSGRGARGRPAVKTAFLAALRQALDDARSAGPAWRFRPDLEQAREAFASDAGYAASMAAAAVTVLRKEHAAALRAEVADSVRAALASCQAAAGQFSCSAVSACGTGTCRFTAARLRAAVPAGPGKLTRPGNHVRSGRGFGTGPALDVLAEAEPFDVRSASAAAA